MMKHYLSTVALLTMMTACSSGSGSNSGSGAEGGALTSQVSGITGINYKIGERTGVVQDGQSIEYQKGDDITFSLGQLKLAKIKAKANIQFADLWPELPDNPKDFRAGLRQYYNVSTRHGMIGSNESNLDQRFFNLFPHYSYGAEPTLHRISNLMQLLLAMDSDGDASNGIDLVSGDWPTKLANFNEHTLPLNTHLVKFRDNPRVKAFSHIHNLPLNMASATPLRTLYQLLNKEINVQPVTGYTIQGRATTFAYVFDRNMRLESEKETLNAGSYTDTKNYKYNDKGRTTEHSETIVQNGSRKSHKIYKYSYTPYGFALTDNNKQYSNDDADPTINTVTTYEIEDNKTLIKNIDERKSGADHADNEIKYTYSEKGWPTEEVKKEYENNQMIISDHRTMTYNEDGNLKKAEKYNYTNGNYIGKNIYEFTYSDKKTTITDKGYSQYDSPVAGSKLRTEFFDDKNRIIKRTLKGKSNESDPYLLWAKEYEYDNQGRLTVCTATEYFPVSEQAKQIKRVKRQYGEHGLSVIIREKTKSENDLTQFDRDGSVREFEYGEDGRITTVKKPDTTQVNGYKRYTFSYGDAYSDDGVAYLIHEMQIIDDRMMVEPCRS